VFISPLALFDNIISYVGLYIYIGVHIKPSFKTKTDRDLQSALRTKWGKSIVINFSLFSSL